MFTREGHLKAYSRRVGCLVTRVVGLEVEGRLFVLPAAFPWSSATPLLRNINARSIRFGGG